MNSRIYINARFLTQRLTGVQRFAYEISKNLSVILKDRVVLIIPKSSKILSCYKHDFIIKRVGVNKGHIWEQIDLFIFLKNKGNPLLLNLTKGTRDGSPKTYNKRFAGLRQRPFPAPLYRSQSVACNW